MKDLVCLVADKNMEATVRGLLARVDALGIRALEFDAFVHPQRDPGCFRNAHEFLRSRRSDYRHGLVLFDRAWEGAPARSAADLEAELRARLWQVSMADWADVIVIDPELEVWVWSDSPHVERHLGWRGRNPGLQTWLRGKGLWEEGRPKPEDPKAAVEQALEAVRLPRSSSIYGKLARSVSVERCLDPGFRRFRELLQSWFPRRPI